uniref:Uncharacterized protein n=1 Tax=Neobodo designis TaxID=312471 RepID=A0A7S1QWK1_NEODS|mmetsp:Transcript_53730/g.165328  ORF Transcript_53730/g.165328 Transcript_53730/m.165328 type:complete len:896 (+) Transcript_53730:119-2806(+)
MGASTSRVIEGCNFTVVGTEVNASDLSLYDCETCRPETAPPNPPWYVAIGVTLFIGVVGLGFLFSLMHVRGDLTRRGRRMLLVVLRVALNIWIIAPKIYGLHLLDKQQVSICGTEGDPLAQDYCDDLFHKRVMVVADGQLNSMFVGLVIVVPLHIIMTTAAEYARWQLLAGQRSRLLQFVKATDGTSTASVSTFALRFDILIATILTMLTPVFLSFGYLALNAIELDAKCVYHAAMIELNYSLSAAVIFFGILGGLAVFIDFVIVGSISKSQTRRTMKVYKRRPYVTRVFLVLMGILGALAALQGLTLYLDANATFAPMFSFLLLLVLPATASAGLFLIAALVDVIGARKSPFLPPAGVSFGGVRPVKELERPVVSLADDIAAFETEHGLPTIPRLADVGAGQAHEPTNAQNETDDASPTEADPDAPATDAAGATNPLGQAPRVERPPVDEPAPTDLIRAMDAAGILVLYDRTVDALPVPWRRAEQLIAACDAHARTIMSAAGDAADSNGLTDNDRFALAAMTWRAADAVHDGATFRAILDGILTHTRGPDQHDTAWVATYRALVLPFVRHVTRAHARLPTPSVAERAHVRLFYPNEFALAVEEPRRVLSAAAEANPQVIEAARLKRQQQQMALSGSWSPSGSVVMQHPHASHHGGQPPPAVPNGMQPTPMSPQSLSASRSPSSAPPQQHTGDWQPPMGSSGSWAGPPAPPQPSRQVISVQPTDSATSPAADNAKPECRVAFARWVTATTNVGVAASFMHGALESDFPGNVQADWELSLMIQLAPCAAAKPLGPYDASRSPLSAGDHWWAGDWLVAPDCDWIVTHAPQGAIHGPPYSGALDSAMITTATLVDAGFSAVCGQVFGLPNPAQPQTPYVGQLPQLPSGQPATARPTRP